MDIELTPPERARRILDTPLDPDNAAGVATVRDYLIALLLALWEQEAGFSGKRPFGDSNWQHDIYAPLVRAGLIDGRLDSYDYVEELDEDAADALIIRAIRLLGSH